MSVAFIFPGQGSQSVAMLSSLAHRPEVARLIQTADEVLGMPLGRLIADGPAEELSLTVNTQPAMLLAGLACLAAWRVDGGPEPDYVAGHSLGEYTALVAAEAMDPAPAFGLVRLRAQAMQEAVPVGVGAMAAILGLSDDQVREACAQARRGPDGSVEVVAPANFNAPAQVVIAGHKAAVERACNAARSLGAKRALPLPVSAPFHSSLLEPAGERLRVALAGIDVRVPRIPLVNNVDVAVESDPARIRDALVRQAYGPVRWVEVVQALAERGVDRFVEFGPGKVLVGLVKRIAPQARTDSVHDAASLAQTLESFK
ncbi:MAG: ACP S-malonyltransferase [Burkholderiaceae bacterium]|nr:ACP S-malonyltransferase [Burkholderiaceae bacterium]